MRSWHVIGSIIVFIVSIYEHPGEALVLRVLHKTSTRTSHAEAAQPISRSSITTTTQHEAPKCRGTTSSGLRGSAGDDISSSNVSESKHLRQEDVRTSLMPSTTRERTSNDDGEALRRKVFANEQGFTESAMFNPSRARDRDAAAEAKQMAEGWGSSVGRAREIIDTISSVKGPSFQELDEIAQEFNMTDDQQRTFMLSASIKRLATSTALPKSPPVGPVDAIVAEKVFATEEGFKKNSAEFKKKLREGGRGAGLEGIVAKKYKPLQPEDLDGIDFPSLPDCPQCSSPAIEEEIARWGICAQCKGQQAAAAQRPISATNSVFTYDDGSEPFSSSWHADRPRHRTSRRTHRLGANTPLPNRGADETDMHTTRTATGDIEADGDARDEFLKLSVSPREELTGAPSRKQERADIESSGSSSYSPDTTGGRRDSGMIEMLPSQVAELKTQVETLRREQTEARGILARLQKEIVDLNTRLSAGETSSLAQVNQEMPLVRNEDDNDPEQRHFDRYAAEGYRAAWRRRRYRAGTRAGPKTKEVDAGTADVEQTSDGGKRSTMTRNSSTKAPQDVFLDHRRPPLSSNRSPWEREQALRIRGRRWTEGELPGDDRHP